MPLVHGRQSFSHFARIFRGDTHDKALARHEHYLWGHLCLKPKMKVLDVGCGTGEAALELASFAGVMVVGVDEDLNKIKLARRRIEEAGLTDQVTFLQVDYKDLSSALEDGSFDAIYAIESLKTAPTFKSMLAQLNRLLRCSGRIAIYEWCWTSVFDPHNGDHCRLAELLEEATCIGHREVAQRTIQCGIESLEDCNFRLLNQEDLASRERSCVIPWYKSLGQAVGNSDISWARVFNGLSKNAATILSQAGAFRLFTPMAMFIAEKKG